MLDLQKIPERIAFLTLLYLHGKITPEQHRELDDWVAASDENLALWEEVTVIPEEDEILRFYDPFYDIDDV